MQYIILHRNRKYNLWRFSKTNHIIECNAKTKSNLNSAQTFVCNERHKIKTFATQSFQCELRNAACGKLELNVSNVHCTLYSM